MNIFLWILQALLAWLAVAGGVYQIFKFDQLKKGVNAMRKLPRGVWTFLGAIGCLAGVGLILPGALDLMPELTVIAAEILAVQSLVISALYLYYRDRAPLPYSLIMTALAVCVAYGRFVLLPL